LQVIRRRRILNLDTRLRGRSRFTRRGEGLKSPRTNSIKFS
jgi:hypothetical protein